MVPVFFKFLNLLAITGIFAQETTGTSMSADDVSIGKEIKEFLPDLDLNGKFKLNLFDHFHNVEQDKNCYRFEFDLTLDINGNIGDNTTYSVIPRLRFDNVSWASEITKIVNIIRGRQEFPANNIDNSQFAVRLSSSTLVDGWDVSLSYYDGIQQIGVARLEQDFYLCYSDDLPLSHCFEYFHIFVKLGLISQLHLINLKYMVRLVYITRMETK
ncbi:GCN5-related N-acetyltransferase [Candidatus Scalindua japonica]|uniref:GCN5-related N-acetyltransferase n=2 Tax=Candidatus Scalindua japonica TaxID=1284222 RepID=A0A286TWJ3_9BACT|nr:GCN5-related N-acetyltransferase [Candidatus Scalindua japonica]